MCGICGIFAPGAADARTALAPLEAMTAALAHRGPDDGGVWRDRASGLGLGHRRLSILDLSPRGRQPMFSASGRYVIVFNGEVYNHAELRSELAPLGHAFRGGSDTEVMLAAIEQWGLVEAVARFAGMFAFALWDSRAHTLSLVRDRFGVKPLYLGRIAGGHAFGSELSALRRHPGFDQALDRGALALYFRHGCVPAPCSIHAAAQKVLPGEIVTLGPDGVSRARYYDAEAVWREGLEHPLDLDEGGAADELERLLSDAVRLRMVADVPVGAFLSGGIDSSLVTALMQAQSPRPVRTFSIGFAEAAYDEAPYARAVAAHLGCRHTELTVTARDLLDIAPDMPRLWDEPFADASQIPTAILCRLARGQVTVALSGDGGDEFFGGYARYGWTLKAHGLLSAAPGGLRRAVHGLLSLAPASWWNALGPRGQKLRSRLSVLGAQGFEALYRHIVAHVKDTRELVPASREPATPAALLAPLGDSPEARLAFMCLCDVLGYLPDDILTKMDRASMAVGLEARAPLLDHRVAQFAARLPARRKLLDGRGKLPLRRLLLRHVPAELVDRPKMGFGVPIAQWLRGELRPWAEDLLSPELLRRQGLLDAQFVARIWREYLAGEGNWSHVLWDVLMFQAWLAQNPGAEVAA
jgi:asparagine synthase (glutamine-hydrolysing)